jgi:hypothetical protein
MALFDIRDNVHLAQQFVAGMMEDGRGARVRSADLLRGRPLP